MTTCPHDYLTTCCQAESVDSNLPLTACLSQGQVVINRFFDRLRPVVLPLFKPFVQLAFREVEALGLLDVGDLVPLDQTVNGGHGKPQHSCRFSDRQKTVLGFGRKHIGELLTDDHSNRRHQPVIGQSGAGLQVFHRAVSRVNKQQRWKSRINS